MMIGYIQIVSLLAAVLLFCMCVASVVLGASDSVTNSLLNAMAAFAILQWFFSIERRLTALEKRREEIEEDGGNA